MSYPGFAKGSALGPIPVGVEEKDNAATEAELEMPKNPSRPKLSVCVERLSVLLN